MRMRQRSTPLRQHGSRREPEAPPERPYPDRSLCRSVIPGILRVEDETQAVADALNLLADIVMAWTRAKMRAIFDRLARRRNGAIPPELIARWAPTRTEGQNMRDISAFRSNSTWSYCCRPGLAQKSPLH
jgi:hypothetical protein